MSDLEQVPVYRMVHSLREEISNKLSMAAQAVSGDSFEEAAILLAEAKRLVLVLEAIMEA